MSIEDIKQAAIDAERFIAAAEEQRRKEVRNLIGSMPLLIAGSPIFEERLPQTAEEGYQKALAANTAALTLEMLDEALVKLHQLRLDMEEVESRLLQIRLRLS